MLLQIEVSYVKQEGVHDIQNDEIGAFVKKKKSNKTGVGYLRVQCFDTEKVNIQMIEDASMRYMKIVVFQR